VNFPSKVPRTTVKSGSVCRATPPTFLQERMFTQGAHPQLIPAYIKRQQINRTTDECSNDRAVYADVLKVATEDQFETVRYRPCIPIPYDLGD
jgi:hypothetical protein